MSHLKRVVGFALVPMLSFVASLLLLPLISARFGTDGLSALTIGQSLGALASVVVGLAWPIVGGQQVAQTPDLPERRRLFVQSCATRAVTVLVCAPPTAVVAAILAPNYRIEAAVLAVAFACNGLTSGWFFAGTGEPLPVVLYEGITRMVAYTVTFVIISLLDLGIWVYSLSMIAWVPVMFWLNWLHVMRGPRDDDFSFPSLQTTLLVIRQQTLGTASRVAHASFNFGGPTVFALFGPASLASFSAADQIQKSATNGSSSLINAFVGWVGSSRKEGEHRSLKALSCCLAGSAMFAPIWFFLGDDAVRIVFSGVILLSPIELTLLGASIVCIFMTRSTELLAMVPFGRERVVYHANTIISVLGLPTLALAAHFWGTSGGLATITLSCVALLCVYACALLTTRATSVPFRRYRIETQSPTMRSFELPMDAPLFDGDVPNVPERHKRP